MIKVTFYQDALCNFLCCVTECGTMIFIFIQSLYFSQPFPSIYNNAKIMYQLLPKVNQ